jgi:hypothetical protein
MQLEAQTFLDLVEKSNKICFWDIEATGLRGDYNSMLVSSIKPYTGRPTTFHINQPGNDKGVALATKKLLESYDCWCTYYGKGFDLKMLDTRLLKWGYPPVQRRHHVDLYFSLKSNLLTARKSQGHLLSWLGTPQQMMGVGADEWNQILFNPRGKHMDTMVARCESDCAGLEGLYKRTRHLLREIKRG